MNGGGGMGVGKIGEVYKCNICGNIVEALFVGGGTLACCGEPMQLMQEKTADAGKEKHVPIIEKTKKGIKAKVGGIPHPMEEAHYIQWIEIIADGKVCRKFLKPGGKPEAEFETSAKDVAAREYCSLHGLWKG